MSKSILVRLDEEDLKDVLDTLQRNELYCEARFFEGKKVDTTELLEALETLDDIYYKDELSGKPKLKRAYTVEEFSNHMKAYNKLYKALGGE